MSREPELWTEHIDFDEDHPETADLDRQLIRDYVETCDSLGKKPTASEFIVQYNTPGTRFDYDAVDGEIERLLIIGKEMRE